MITSEVRHLKQLKGDFRTSLSDLLDYGFFANNVKKNVRKMKSEPHLYSNNVYSVPAWGICIFICTPEDIGQAPPYAFIKLRFVLSSSDLFCLWIKNFNSSSNIRNTCNIVWFMQCSIANDRTDLFDTFCRHIMYLHILYGMKQREDVSSTFWPSWIHCCWIQVAGRRMDTFLIAFRRKVTDNWKVCDSLGVDNSTSCKCSVSQPKGKVCPH